MNNKLGILALVFSVVSLVSCGGGFNDLEYAQSGASSITSRGSDSKSKDESLWEYTSITDFKSAKSISLNTVPTSNPNNDAVMIVQINRLRHTDGHINEYLVITVLFADTACDISCNLRYKKNNSNNGVYRVVESIESVFNEDSFNNSDMKKLIRAIKGSESASITVPLMEGQDAEFQFDFSGYNYKIMELDGE